MLLPHLRRFVFRHTLSAVGGVGREGAVQGTQHGRQLLLQAGQQVANSQQLQGMLTLL